MYHNVQYHVVFFQPCPCSWYPPVSLYIHLYSLRSTPKSKHADTDRDWLVFVASFEPGTQEEHWYSKGYKGMLNLVDVQKLSPSKSTAGTHLDIKSGAQFEYIRTFVVMPLHHEDSGSLALSVAVCLSNFLAQQLGSGKAPCVLRIKTDKFCRLKKRKYIELSHQPLALLKQSSPKLWRCGQTANEISETSARNIRSQPWCDTAGEKLIKRQLFQPAPFAPGLSAHQHLPGFSPPRGGLSSWHHPRACRLQEDSDVPSKNIYHKPPAGSKTLLSSSLFYFSLSSSPLSFIL